MKEIVAGLWDIDEIGPAVHAFAWQWEQGVTLVDTGPPGSAQVILEAIGTRGFQPSDVQRIIVTHVDSDHVGGLKALQRLTGAPVSCHTVERALLLEPGKRTPGRNLSGYLLRPVYEVARRIVPALRIAPVTPDEIYVDGSVLPEGFTIIHTPGHTPGHISLLHTGGRFLITGDALNNRGGTLAEPPAIFTPDIDNARRSIWKLWKRYRNDFDALAFGHGEPITENTQDRLQQLIDQLFETNEV